MPFLTPAGGYDRRQIMREAHRLHRRALGPLSFGDALRLAWARARSARQQRLAEAEAFQRVRWAA